MTHYHAVVWIDHQEARIFQFDIDTVEKSVVHPEHPHQKLHHKAGSIGSGNHIEDKRFYHTVAEALVGAHEILIVGPGHAKHELYKHLQNHDRLLAEYVVGVEAMDHPTDGQIVAHARQYFKKADQMLPQR